MKKISWCVALIIMHLNIQAQRPRPIPPRRVPQIEEQKVELYENTNFTGTVKLLSPGQYVLSDFNDIASSVRVPPGLVAVIYEHADNGGKYGMSVDLMEDCPDLSGYDFNDKTSYIVIFNSVKYGTPDKPGNFYYRRNRKGNGQFVPGHWERERVNGQKPDNSPPAVVFLTTDPDDIESAPLASQAEIDEFNNVQKNQLGVGVLAGETTKPFYYHNNEPGEEVYKYNKIIDPARLPGKFYDWMGEKLGRAGILVKPLAVIDDVSLDIKDWIFGSSSSKVKMDCWYPDSEFKTTVCGTMEGDAFICPQDYLHTQVTVDKDVNFEILPYDKFKPMLVNRWIGDKFNVIEGEVKAKNLSNFNPGTNKTTETTSPVNPLLMKIKKDDNVCLHGPWMGDILDLNAKLPVPFTDSKIELVNIDLRNNNEIHPVNQLWRKVGNETQLIAIVDGTGYFQKMGNSEVAASGLNQRMRFYFAFILSKYTAAINNSLLEFDINGIGFDFTDVPAENILPKTITLKQNGAVRVKVNDNSSIRNQNTHKVFFEKVRKTANGSVLGYIVVETEPISKQGGSINIFVKNITKVKDLPVITEQQ
jgi:hypothetical protein